MASRVCFYLQPAVVLLLSHSVCASVCVQFFTSIRSFVFYFKCCCCCYCCSLILVLKSVKICFQAYLIKLVVFKVIYCLLWQLMLLLLYGYGHNSCWFNAVPGWVSLCVLVSMPKVFFFFCSFSIFFRFWYFGSLYIFNCLPVLLLLLLSFGLTVSQNFGCVYLNVCLPACLPASQPAGWLTNCYICG